MLRKLRDDEIELIRAYQEGRYSGRYQIDAANPFNCDDLRRERWSKGYTDGTAEREHHRKITQGHVAK